MVSCVEIKSCGQRLLIDFGLPLDSGNKPEVIFILANHNPRSSKLNTILDNPQIDAYQSSPNFDLRFYVASFAGYALHTDCMVTLDQFRKILGGN